MKAVILAGGIGKRLRPITESVPKALVEVNGKPILERIILSLKGNGINEFVIVVSYMKEKITGYFGDGSRFGVKIAYVTQPEQRGTGDALRYAGPEINENKFLAVYGDLFFDSAIIKEAIAESEKCDGIICVKNVDDPKRFGVLEMEGEKVRRIVEKSDNPPSNLANAGIYVFPREIFGAIEKTGLSPRGEYELTDSVNILIERGMEFHAVRMPETWIDVGNIESLEKARRSVKK